MVGRKTSRAGRFATCILLAFAVVPAVPAESDAEVPAAIDPRVRIARLLQLGRSRSPEARGELEASLSDPSEPIRIAAANGLRALNDPAALAGLLRRAGIEQSPAVKTSLDTAITALQKSRFDSAKFVVQVGSMSNGAHVQNALIVGVMRSATKTHAATLRGALVADGPSDAILQRAQERRLPVLVLDGNLSRLSRADAQDNVTLAAQVEFVVRRAPSQALKATFRGRAAGSDTPNALAKPERVMALQGEVVSGAVESALRGAESGLAEASK